MRQKQLKSKVDIEQVDIEKIALDEKIEFKSIINNEKNKKTKIKCEISDFNNYLFHEGRNYYSYTFMGAHIVTEKRKKGTRFTTWAPNAKNVYIVGDFNDFQINDKYKMERISSMGLWSLFLEDINEGMKYKYSIEDGYGNHNYKADPYGFAMELRPNTASIIFNEEKNKYKWNDRSWMTKRRYFNMYKSPINIYELHLGSWKRENGEFLSYIELSEKLPRYVKEMGYTHVELMPLVEHPLDASWGYQGVGYFSATSRFGNLNEFKKLIDEFHKVGVGVILDWVPGHFCKDAHGLYRFDGTPTYEYEEAWKAENRGWGTCNFDLGRPEVKSFLLSNAVYWIKEFHIDGLRVDAVSNMLYLDYGRNNGEWIPNIYGGNGNLEAIEFIKSLNTMITKEFPTVMMIAEESTSWPMISKPIDQGGLGFNFKWNMGWMHDTLSYMKEDPINRKYHHNKVNFSMLYHYSENFILSISHDEVVHGKGSLINKMWGDSWNKFASLRLYAAHMMGHPGKKLLFMGSELGLFNEWQEYEELEWNLVEEHEIHKKTQNYFKTLNKLYINNKALWQLDYENKGFIWLDADDSERSIYSFMRNSEDNEDMLIFVCNYTPVVHYGFRVGVPYNGEYQEVFNSDAIEFGGSGQIIEDSLFAEDIPFNNQDYSIQIKVPPMAAIVLKVKKH